MSASAALGADGLNLLLERVAELQHALEDGTRRQSAREARMIERIEQVECVDREQRTAITRRVEEIAMSATAFTTTSSSSSAAGGTAGSTVAAAQMLVEMDDLQDSVMADVKALLTVFKSRHDALKETTTSRLSVLEQSVVQLRQAATAAAASPPPGLGRRRSSLSHARASLRGGLVDSHYSDDDGDGDGGTHRHHHHQLQQQRLDALEHEVRDINANITEALQNLRAGEAAAAAAPALDAASPVTVTVGGGGGVRRREVELSAFIEEKIEERVAAEVAAALSLQQQQQQQPRPVPEVSAPVVLHASSPVVSGDGAPRVALAEYIEQRAAATALHASSPVAVSAHRGVGLADFVDERVAAAAPPALHTTSSVVVVAAADDTAAAAAAAAAAPGGVAAAAAGQSGGRREVTLSGYVDERARAAAAAAVAQTAPALRASSPVVVEAPAAAAPKQMALASFVDERIAAAAAGAADGAPVILHAASAMVATGGGGGGGRATGGAAAEGPRRQVPLSEYVDERVREAAAPRALRATSSVVVTAAPHDPAAAAAAAMAGGGVEPEDREVTLSAYIDERVSAAMSVSPPPTPSPPRPQLLSEETQVVLSSGGPATGTAGTDQRLTTGFSSFRWSPPVSPSGAAGPSSTGLPAAAASSSSAVPLSDFVDRRVDQRIQEALAASGGLRSSLRRASNASHASSRASSRVCEHLAAAEAQLRRQVQGATAVAASAPAAPTPQALSLRRDAAALKRYARQAAREVLGGGGGGGDGAAAVDVAQRVEALEAALGGELAALRASAAAACPGKAAAEGYAEFRSQADLRTFAEKVVAAWSGKDGSLLEELRANLVFPAGADALEALATAAGRIKSLKGAAYPGRSGIELLVMALYTMVWGGRGGFWPL